MRHERWRLPAARIATAAKFRGRISLKVYRSAVKTKWQSRRRPACTATGRAAEKLKQQKNTAPDGSTSQSQFRLHLGFTGTDAPVTTALTAIRSNSYAALVTDC